MAKTTGAAVATVMLIAGIVAGTALAQSNTLQHVRLVGRFLEDGSRAAFEWPGSTIEIRFQGSRLNVVFDDTGNNSMVVDLDGAISRLNLKKGRNDYEVVAADRASAHAVRLTRRTEAMLGQTILEQVRTDGSFLPVEVQRRSLLVIGDSISAGYGIEGKDTKCGFTADTENQYLTYAAVAARSFDADLTTLAISGKGLARNYDGSTTQTMPDIYRRLMPSRDIDAPLPKTDVIVVHLGSNDFSEGARPADFVTRYNNLLSELRLTSPRAQIYLGIGPMLAGDDRTAAFAAVDEVARTRQGAGDTRVAPIEFTDPPGVASRGCDWHPNEAGQQFMGKQLEQRIAKDLGWSGAE